MWVVSTGSYLPPNISCQLHPDHMGCLCKYPLQWFSFPHSAPPLPMFRAGREHCFQGQNRLELASLYQRIRDSEIKIFQRPYCTSKSIRNPSDFHSPTMRSIPNWRRRVSFRIDFCWVIVLESFHLTNLSIVKSGCEFLTTPFLLLKRKGMQK